MKKLSLKLLGLIAVSGLLWGLAGCCTIVKSCLQQILILGQPQSLTLLTNADATFSVFALAGPPFTNSGLTYQWQFNGILLYTNDVNWADITNNPEATSSSITISNIQLGDVGYYRVKVSSGSSTLVSDPASLQEITGGGSILVYGTPIAGSPTRGYCTGPFAGYINYTNCFPCRLWGWAVSNPNVTISATDGVEGNPNMTQLQYLGCNGDPGCGAAGSGTVSKQPPLQSPNGSPRYIFTLCFPSGLPVPTNPRPYPIRLENLQ